MGLPRAVVVVILLGALLAAPLTSAEPERVEVRAWSVLADYDAVPFAYPPGGCQSEARMGPDGVLRYAYVSDSQLYFASEGDPAPTRISGITVYCWGIDLAFRPNGSAVIGWIDLRNQWASPSDGTPAGWDLFVATEATGWTEVLVSSGTDQRVNSLRIDVDAVSDEIVAAYTRFTMDGFPYYETLFLARSPLWQEVRVSDGVDVRGYDLALDSRGRAHAAWTLLGDLETVWYANESSGWQNVRVDADQSSDWWDDRRDPSLAIDGTDQAHIVWCDARSTPAPGYPVRTEVWHASTAGGFANSELVVPDDAAPFPEKWYPQAEFDPAGGMHVVFGGWSVAGDRSLYYANSTDWSRAVRVVNRTATDHASGKFGLHPFARLSGAPTLLFEDDRIGVEALWRTTPWDFAPDTTPPHAPVLPDRIADPLVGVRFEARGAWDNDRIEAYAWEIAGPETLSLAGYAQVVNLTTAGDYTVTLTVRDPAGLTASTSFGLTVRPPPRYWALGKVLYPTNRAYGYLELHPWSNGSFPLTFFPWDDHLSRHSASGATTMGPIFMQPSAPRESALFDPAGDLHTVGYEWVSKQLEYTKATAEGVNLIPPKALPLGGLLPQQPYLAWGGDRVWLGWMDQRDGNFEVYLASLDLSGNVTWGPARVSNHPLDSDEPVLLVAGDRLWVVWRDERLYNWGVYGSVLNLTTLAWEFQERRLGNGILDGADVLPDGGVGFTALGQGDWSVFDWELYLHRVDRAGSPASPPLLVSVPNGFPAGMSDVDFDAQGTAHVVWLEAGFPSTLRYARVALSGPPEPDGGLLLHKFTGDDTPMVSVRVGPDGEPRVAFTDGSAFTGASAYFAYRDPVPPDATIDVPSQIDPGEPATFRGDRSTYNMVVASWRWDLGDGTSATGPTVEKTYAIGGTYDISLTVTDEAGNSHTRSAEVRVGDTTPPIAVIDGPSATEVGVAATYTAAGSTDSVGITTYQWTISGPWSTAVGGMTLEVTFPSPGPYLVELTVRDAAGNEDIARMYVNVTAPQPPPGPNGPGDGAINPFVLYGVLIAGGTATGVAVAWLVVRKRKQRRPKTPAPREREV